MSLPKWASYSDGKYVIDGNKAYPALLKELAGLRDRLDAPTENEPDYVKELRKLDTDKPDQYWLEVVYQMAKLDLRRALLMEGESAWPNEIHIRADKSKWRLADHPVGRGAPAATTGKEARAHYIALRGFIPN